MFKKEKKKKLIGEKKDYSKKCTHDDKHDTRCLLCTKYVFPIGCTLHNYNAFK
jgi:hypothetical protein